MGDVDICIATKRTGKKYADVYTELLPKSVRKFNKVSISIFNIKRRKKCIFWYM